MDAYNTLERLCKYILKKYKSEKYDSTQILELISKRVKFIEDHLHPPKMRDLTIMELGREAKKNFIFTNPKDFVWLKTERTEIYCDCDGKTQYILHYYSLERELYILACPTCGGHLAIRKKTLQKLGFIPFTAFGIQRIKDAKAKNELS